MAKWTAICYTEEPNSLLAIGLEIQNWANIFLSAYISPATLPVLEPFTSDLTQIVVIFLTFLFQPASKVSTLYNLLPQRNSKKSSNVETPSRNFEGAGNGEIKYEEQDFSNIISTTILQ